MFTSTQSTWYSNRESRARAYGGGAAISREKLAISWERVGKRVVAGEYVKGVGNVVERRYKG